jgi:hypothetical protein
VSSKIWTAFIPILFFLRPLTSAWTCANTWLRFSPKLDSRHRQWIFDTTITLQITVLGSFGSATKFCRNKLLHFQVFVDIWIWAHRWHLKMEKCIITMKTCVILWDSEFFRMDWCWRTLWMLELMVNLVSFSK